MRYLFVFFLLTTYSLYGQIDQTYSILFDFDDSAIRSEHINALEEIKLKEEKGNVQITSIKAFCDTSGSSQYNQELARKRYDRVLEYLGADDSDLKKKIIGEEYDLPRIYNAQQYRRVDITYIESTPVSAVELPESELKDITQEFESFLKDEGETETIIRLDIHFFPGSRSLLPESEPELWKLFDFLHYNQNITAFIRGHVCCSDDMPLSIERAQVVYNFLIDRSISPDRLSYKGFSNTVPSVTPEVTEKDRIMNRRVDVIFTKTE